MAEISGLFGKFLKIFNGCLTSRYLILGSSPALLQGVHDEGELALDLASAGKETQDLQRCSVDPPPWSYLSPCPVVCPPSLQLLQLLPHLLIHLQLKVLGLEWPRLVINGCGGTKVGKDKA